MVMINMDLKRSAYLIYKEIFWVYSDFIISDYILKT